MKRAPADQQRSAGALCLAAERRALVAARPARGVRVASATAGADRAVARAGAVLDRGRLADIVVPGVEGPLGWLLIRVLVRERLLAICIGLLVGAGRDPLAAIRVVAAARLLVAARFGRIDCVVGVLSLLGHLALCVPPFRRSAWPQGTCQAKGASG